MPTLTQTEQSTIDKPRILCLHGGGTNATVLRLQLRTYISLLAPHFRLVYVDAPFEAAAHPDIIPVYADYGPFRCWYRWRADQAVCGGVGEDREGDKVLAEWDRVMRAAMRADDEAGATGEWVGLLGFSQGARVAGSLLFEGELRQEAERASAWGGYQEDSWDDMPLGFAGQRWRFGVLLAGRGPFLALSELGCRDVATENLGGVSNTTTLRRQRKGGARRLKLPTVHVHGLVDAGLPFHREYRDMDFEKSSSTVLEWDGAHRLGYKTSDVEPVVARVVKIARDLGILEKEPEPIPEPEPEKVQVHVHEKENLPHPFFRSFSWDRRLPVDAE